MKNVIKIVSILIIATIILNITSVITLAKDTENGQATLSVNISKDFKKWTELSDEERKNSIMPAVSTSTLSEVEKKDANSIWGNVKNFFARASIPSKYSLKDYINIPVKNQGITGECWAFSMTSVLESYLAKSGQMTVIPRYSARHMDYATSKTFLDGTNPIAYNRELGDGGNFGVAFGYLTNGTGAVLEKDMPFENNENKINLSEIQKQPQMRVTDYQLFPNINKTFDSSGNVTYTDDMGEEYTKDEVNQIRNEIKQFIMKYGGITVNTYSRGLQYYSNPSQYDKSVAYFCNDNDYAIDHEITIVGWDDNYSVDNFNKEYQEIASAEIVFKEKMPMFEKNEDEYIPILFETVAKKVGLIPEISSFHAGAETHIYANRTNANGEKFSPYLIGLATVCNMHSDREYVDYKTMIKGQELLKELFESFNK